LNSSRDLQEHGVSVTTFMPGATDSDFRARAGMNNTAFGPGMTKNRRKDVARQGFLVMMDGQAEVVGGDATTRCTAVKNRFLPETLKAALRARRAKPGS
jgi:short-subunit dehydrogenase